MFRGGFSIPMQLTFSIFEINLVKYITIETRKRRMKKNGQIVFYKRYVDHTLVFAKSSN